SNAGVNPPAPAGRRPCCARAISVNARSPALAARTRQKTEVTGLRSAAGAARAGPGHLPLGDLPFRETFRGGDCGASRSARACPNARGSLCERGRSPRPARFDQTHLGAMFDQSRRAPLLTPPPVIFP